MSLATSCLAVGGIAYIIPIHEVLDVLGHHKVKRLELGSALLHDIIKLINTWFFLCVYITDDNFGVVSTGVSL